MPSLLLTNTNRLCNKLDELYVICSLLTPSIIAITESWLTTNITDDAISLNRYQVYRRDRVGQIGGGVMMYVRNDIASKHLTSYDSDMLEVLFVSLRPKLLPRPFTIVVVCVAYCPPWYSADNKNFFINHIVSSIDNIYRNNPHAAVIVCGDFNQLDTNSFNRYLLLQQFVCSTTRGNNILDKVFINACKSHYTYPAEILPPLGKSDHCCVFIRPKCCDSIADAGWRSVFKRVINNASIDSIGRKLALVNWSPLYRLDDVQEQTDYFYSIMNNVVDSVAPMCEIRYKSSDRPWVTPYFKKLIAQRNSAHKTKNFTLYKHLRNKANRIGRNLKKDFYFHQVENCKSSNPSKWWKNVKAITGFSSKSNNDKTFHNIRIHNNDVGDNNLADVINSFFLSCTNAIPRLPTTVLNDLRSKLVNVNVPDEFIVSEFSVYDALCKLKCNKSTGPDNLPNSLLKSIADLISAPVCCIINSSIRFGTVPTQWKLSRVIPLPKLFPPLHIETDIRPISITSPLSKLAESFMCNYFNCYFNEHLDSCQFGCTTGRSTTFALVKLSHFLFNSTDKTDVFCRLLFIDFTKAFDLIDHNILLRKMHDLNIPIHLTTWFMSFLSDRSQFVQISSSSSFIGQTNAGTPQGTLSGPLDFKVLINDLTFDELYIKYVDDTTAAVTSNDPLDNSLQTAADKLYNWCLNNHMVINIPKTKDMLIYFGKKYPRSAVPKVHINNHDIDRVSTYKLLGVVFNDRLTWDNHVAYIVGKASKRIFCITQLSRARVIERDIVIIYCSIVRSILEYCCEVWHCGLTGQQSRDIERVQKRCLAIIYPDLPYSSALLTSGLERLDYRRENKVRELFEDIKKPNHILHYLLTPRQVNPCVRSASAYYLPRFRTSRARREFLNYCLFKYK